MCDSGKFMDTIRVTFDSPVTGQDKDGITSLQFKCSDITDQDGSRDASFKIVGTPSGTTQDTYTTTDSHFCGIGSLKGSLNSDFLGLVNIDLMLCETYDCRSSLVTQSSVEDRVYKVEAGQQDKSNNILEMFSNYLKNSNT